MDLASTSSSMNGRFPFGSGFLSDGFDGVTGIVDVFVVVDVFDVFDVVAVVPVVAVVFSAAVNKLCLPDFPLFFFEPPEVGMSPDGANGASNDVEGFPCF